MTFKEISEGRGSWLFCIEGIVRTKVSQWERDWGIQGTGKNPVWLKVAKDEEGKRI